MKGHITINYDNLMNHKFYDNHHYVGPSVAIDGQKISDVVWRLDAIEQRLAILTPDPKQLEKFETLRRVYEQYQMVEALCRERSEK